MAKNKPKIRKPARPTAKPAAKRPPARKARRSAAAGKATKTPPSAKAGKRQSWLNPKSHAPVIEHYARQLGSFIQAMTDGKVDASEVAAQETRLVKLMKEIEPALDNALHEKVTRLLCELTAYDIMQMLHAMQAHRPQRVFRG